MKYDFISGIQNRFLKALKKFAFIWLRDRNMIAMRPAECHIFLCRKHSLSIKLPFFKVNISIVRRIGITERPVLILCLRFEVFGIHLLDSAIQLLIGCFIIPFGQHHCQGSISGRQRREERTSASRTILEFILWEKWPGCFQIVEKMSYHERGSRESVC